MECDYRNGIRALERAKIHENKHLPGPARAGVFDNERDHRCLAKREVFAASALLLVLISLRQGAFTME